MVFICIICMIKQPPLTPLSDEHRQLLEVIVSPVTNTTELKGYQWLHCSDCEVLMRAVHNFQQTALKGVKAFKYLLSKNEPAITQTTLVTPILEAKPEPITIKTEPGINPPTTNQEKSFCEEVNFNIKIETDSNSDSTMSCDGDSDLDPDPTRQSIKESTDPLRESTSLSKKILRPMKVITEPVSQNVVKKVPVILQNASNSQVRVYSKKPDSNHPKPQISKVVIIVPPKNVPSAKDPPSAKVSTITRPISKAMVAENAAKVPKRDSSEAGAGQEGGFEFFPGFARALEDYKLERERAKKKKYKRKQGPRVTCPHCNKSLKDKQVLKLHIAMIHGEAKPVACEVCGKVCRNDFTLKWHHKNKHKKEINTLEDLKPDLYCKQCEVQFPSQSALKQHLLGLKHTPREQYTFVCETCNRRFPTQSRRELHVNVVHLNKKQHKCSTCGKRYAKASQLRRHVATAHEDAPKRRPHVCHLCGKSFTVIKSLREHLLSHQGIRPFQCKLCPATFSYSAALYTHNRLKHLKMKWKKKKTEKDEGNVEKGVEKENEAEEGNEAGKGVEGNDAEKGAQSIDIDQFFNKTV
ncbi:zinc finger Y-chromosomal protein-like [Cydia fagiglandana]|uniref:zinc finger Y-chromosomal protein-like n=1 Tax=Cydia fagiglandana TaxID=1458189 RepID=UPI002FEE0994